VWDIKLGGHGCRRCCRNRTAKRGWWLQTKPAATEYLAFSTQDARSASPFFARSLFPSQKMVILIYRRTKNSALLQRVPRQTWRWQLAPRSPGGGRARPSKAQGPEHAIGAHTPRDLEIAGVMHSTYSTSTSTKSRSRSQYLDSVPSVRLDYRI
jgi:hypothetical protein